MKLLLHPLFICCALAFIIHQVLQKILGVEWRLADLYLDSLLAMPIILTLWLVERRILFKKGADYTLSVQQVTIATLYIFIVSNILFPIFSARFTRDWIDGLFYMAGSALFYYTINNSVVKQTREN